MKRHEIDIPGEMIEEFTARAAVLADMYRELSDPKTAATVIGGLAVKNRDIHTDFLDRLKPDRWPLGRLDLCLRIPDYIRHEFLGPPRDVPVMVLRSPLSDEDAWRAFIIFWRCQRKGHAASTREASVFKGQNGAIPMGVRTIVDPGPCQDDLNAAGLLEDANERVRDTLEYVWPTGGYLNLCLPG